MGAIGRGLRIVGAAVAVLALSSCDTKGAISADSVIRAYSQDDFAFTVSGVEDRSDELCPEHEGCRQAVVTDQLIVWKFGSRDDAAAYAGTVSDDSYLSDYIVIEFTSDELTPEQREIAGEYVDGMHVSE